MEAVRDVQQKKQLFTDAQDELRSAVTLLATVKDAVTKVVPVGPRGSWVAPVPGAITSEAGMRQHPILDVVRCHAGVDMTAPVGVPVRAVDRGVVVKAGMNGGYGNYVEIAHEGVSTSYAHLNSIEVETGQMVKRGRTIGTVGSTGLSTGPHLHFEVTVNDRPYNPRGWLDDIKQLRQPSCGSDA